MDLTPEKKVGVGSTAVGLVLLFGGTYGVSGIYPAMISLGGALIVLGAGFLGFSSARSGTTTGGR